MSQISVTRTKLLPIEEIVCSKPISHITDLPRSKSHAYNLEFNFNSLVKVIEFYECLL